MNKEELKRLQQSQLQMLKDVDRVCKENNIEYYVTWGSALGAVRHGGFIPWDDDIDISMTWNNYVKFEEIAPKELNSKYFYQSMKTDKEYFIAWNKIRINNTTSMEPKLKHMRCHYGICMDVFPIIGVPKSGVKKSTQKVMILAYRALKYEKYLTNRKPEGNTMFKIAYGILPRSFKALLDKNLLKAITKYDINSADELVEFFTNSYNKTLFPKNVFGNGHKIMFEDMEVTIPEKYHEYLEKTYGDYMTLPPEADRIGHGESILDFDKSYEYYWEN